MSTPSIKIETWATNHGPESVSISIEITTNGPKLRGKLIVVIGRDRWEIDGLRTVQKEDPRRASYWLVPWANIPKRLQTILLERFAIQPKRGRKRPRERSDVYAHRLVAALCLSESIEDMEIDHYNEDGLDNRVENLIPREKPAHRSRHLYLDAFKYAYDLNRLRRMEPDFPEGRDCSELTEEPPDEPAEETARKVALGDAIAADQERLRVEAVLGAAELAFVEETEPTSELVHSAMLIAILAQQTGDDVFELARQLRVPRDVVSMSEPFSLAGLIEAERGRQDIPFH
jgi:hypothetical protein